MKKGSEKRWRKSILSGTFALENRELLSSFARMPINPEAAQVGILQHTSPEAVRTSHAQTGPSARVASHPSGHLVGTAVFPTVRRWSWLANTYWYVPPANLPAVLYNSSTGTLAPVRDQTVFHITGYRNAYFWGNSVTQLGSTPPAYSSMLGSVTPEGQLLLTFTLTSDSTSPSITEGFGKMQRKSGQWTMENQMFTSPNETLQIGHWAYMVRTHPGLPSWHSLPSAGISVPAFLNQG